MTVAGLLRRRRERREREAREWVDGWTRFIAWAFVTDSRKKAK